MEKSLVLLWPCLSSDRSLLLPGCGRRTRGCECQGVAPLGQPGGHCTCLCRFHAVGQLPREPCIPGDTVLWWAGKSGCPVLSPSPLTCPSFSILSRKIHRFLPVSQTSQPRPTPAFSLPFFFAFLSSLHFLFLPHSLLCIHFPESAGFNFQNDYKEQVQEEWWKPKYSGPLRLEFFSLKRHLLQLPKDIIPSEQRPQGW